MYLGTTEETDPVTGDDMEWLATPRQALEAARDITLDLATFQTDAANLIKNRSIRSGVALAWVDETRGIVKPFDTPATDTAAGYLIDPVLVPVSNGVQLTAGNLHGNLMTRGAVLKPRLPIAPAAEFETALVLIEHRSV